MSRTSRLLRATLPFTFAALGIAQSAHAQNVAAGADQSVQDAPADNGRGKGKDKGNGGGED